MIEEIRQYRFQKDLRSHQSPRLVRREQDRREEDLRSCHGQHRRQDRGEEDHGSELHMSCSGQQISRDLVPGLQVNILKCTFYFKNEITNKKITVFSSSTYLC